jgi:hypothetical protein
MIYELRLRDGGHVRSSQQRGRLRDADFSHVTVEILSAVFRAECITS